MTSRLTRLGDALSQFGNVLIFNGDPNYSISGEAWRKGRHGLRRSIDWLFSPFEADHCRTAYLNDVQKARALVVESMYHKGRKQ